MFEEIGTVKSIEGMFAKVSVPKKSACDGCTAGTCKAEDQSMEIEAINRAGAVAGQKVKVMIQSSEYVKGTVVVYGIPAFALVLGAVFGKEIAPGLLPFLDPDLLSAFFGFGFLILSFILVKAWSARKSAQADTKPVIEEILD